MLHKQEAVVMAAPSESHTADDFACDAAVDMSRLFFIKLECELQDGKHSTWNRW